MRRIIIALLCSMLLLCMGCDIESSSFIDSNKVVTSSVSSISSTSSTVIAEVEKYYDEDTYNNGTLTFTSNEPMAFCNLFPDPYVAVEVSALFDKKATDVVTLDKLKAFTGRLDIGPMFARDLTGIGYLTGLTELSCYKNYVEILPAEIAQMKNLRILSLTKAYGLKMLPPEIGLLGNLEELYLSMTVIKVLPSELGSLKKLRVLNIAANSIRELPNSIGDLANLEELNVSSLQLTEIPDNLCRLTKLRRLDLGHNNLTQLPNRIGDLTSLEYLNLFGCDLRQFPDSIRLLTKLTYLNVYDNYNLNENYKTYIPEDVWKCGV